MTANLFTALTIALTSLKQRLNPYIQDSFNRLSTNRLLHSQSWQVTHLEVIRSMVSIIQYQKIKNKWIFFCFKRVFFCRNMAETMSMMLRLGQRALGRLPISKQMGSRQCSTAAATAVNKSKSSGASIDWLLRNPVI